MSKRLIGLFIVLLILAACGEDSPETQPTLVRPTVTPAPTTLTIWYHDPRMTEAYTAVLADFETRYPHITTHLMLQEGATFLNDINQSLEAGGEPDVILAPAVLLDPLLARRSLLPLTLSESSQIRMLVPVNAAEVGVRNEQIYGFPVQINVPILVYDSSRVPDVPQNYDAFVQSGHETIVRPNFMTTSLWMPIANTASARTPDGRLNVTADGLTAYFQRLLDMSATVSFADDFSTSNAAVYLASTADLPVLREKLGDTLRIAPLPDLASLPQNNLYVGEATLFMVSQNASDADYDASLKLLEFLLDPEQQDKMSEISGYLPILSADYNAQRAVFFGDSQFYTEVVPGMDTAIQQVITGQLTPQQASEQWLND